MNVSPKHVSILLMSKITLIRLKLSSQAKMIRLIMLADLSNFCKAILKLRKRRHRLLSKTCKV